MLICFYPKSNNYHLRIIIGGVFNADSGRYNGSALLGNRQAQPVQGFPRISDDREDYVGESGSTSAPPQQRVIPGDGSSASSNQKSNGHSLDNSPLENSNPSTL